MTNNNENAEKWNRMQKTNSSVTNAAYYMLTSLWQNVIFYKLDDVVKPRITNTPVYINFAYSITLIRLFDILQPHLGSQKRDRCNTGYI